MSEVNITDSVLKRHHEQQLSAGRLSSAPDNAKVATAAVSSGAAGLQSNAPSHESAAPAVHQATGTGGLMKKLVPVILVAVVIWLAIKFFGS